MPPVLHFSGKRLCVYRHDDGFAAIALSYNFNAVGRMLAGG